MLGIIMRFCGKMPSLTKESFVKDATFRQLEHPSPDGAMDEVEIEIARADVGMFTWRWIQGDERLSDTPTGDGTRSFN